MDDTAAPEVSPPSRPRRRGLTSPLPAVVVGLGLASAPVAAQVPVVARDDYFQVPADQATLLPVLGNDTLNNVAPTFFDGVSFPKPGQVNVVNFVGIYYTPPNGFRGQATFDYCIESFSPGSNSCATVQILVSAPATPVPALGGVALAGLSGVLGWLGLRLRRRA